MITRSKGVPYIADIAYLAGIIDGEGTIYIGFDKTRGYHLRFYVVNTDKRLIDWLKTTFGGSVYSRKSLKNPNWRRKYEWINVNPEDMLPEILPFLKIKKEQAMLAIKFRKTFVKKKHRLTEETKLLRAECYKQMKKLNNGHTSSCND